MVGQFIPRKDLDPRLVPHIPKNWDAGLARINLAGKLYYLGPELSGPGCYVARAKQTEVRMKEATSPHVVEFYSKLWPQVA